MKIIERTTKIIEPFITTISRRVYSAFALLIFVVLVFSAYIYSATDLHQHHVNFLLVLLIGESIVVGLGLSWLLNKSISEPLQRINHLLRNLHADNSFKPKMIHASSEVDVSQQLVLSFNEQLKEHNLGVEQRIQQLHDNLTNILHGNLLSIKDEPSPLSSLDKMGGRINDVAGFIKNVSQDLHLLFEQLNRNKLRVQFDAQYPGELINLREQASDAVLHLGGVFLKFSENINHLSDNIKRLHEMCDDADEVRDDSEQSTASGYTVHSYGSHAEDTQATQQADNKPSTSEKLKTEIAQLEQTTQTLLKLCAAWQVDVSVQSREPALS